MTFNKNTALTFVEGGITETPAGVAVNYLYDTKQNVYNNVLRDFYTNQAIYNNVVKGFDVKQTVYSNKAATFYTSQFIFSSKSFNYDTMQEIFNASVIRSYLYDIKVSMYKQIKSDFDAKQLLYKANEQYAALRQEIIHAISLPVETKQIIYKQIQNNLNTLQQMFNTQSIDLDTLIKIDAEFKVYKNIFKASLEINRVFTFDAKITRKGSFTFKI